MSSGDKPTSHDNAHSLYESDAQSLLLEFLEHSETSNTDRVRRSVIRFERELRTWTTLDSILDILSIEPFRATIISAGVLNRSIPDDNRGPIKVRDVAEFINYVLDNQADGLNPLCGLITWEEKEMYDDEIDVELSDVFDLAQKRTQVMTLFVPLLSGLTVTSGNQKRGINTTRISQRDTKESELIRAYENTKFGRVPVFFNVLIHIDKSLIAQYYEDIEPIADDLPYFLLPSSKHSTAPLTGDTINKMMNKLGDDLFDDSQEDDSSTDSQDKPELDRYLSGHFVRSCADVFENTRVDILNDDIDALRRALADRIEIDADDITVDGSGVKEEKLELTGRSETQLGILLKLTIVPCQNAIRSKFLDEEPVSPLRADWLDVTSPDLLETGPLHSALIYFGFCAMLSLPLIAGGTRWMEIAQLVTRNPLATAFALLISIVASPWRSLVRDSVPYL